MGNKSTKEKQTVDGSEKKKGIVLVKREKVGENDSSSRSGSEHGSFAKKTLQHLDMQGL